MKIFSKPPPDAPIGRVEGDEVFASSELLAFLDDIEESSSLIVTTVANLPEAGPNQDERIVVSDEAGGRTIAWSDGTNWLRIRDNVIVS